MRIIACLLAAVALLALASQVSFPLGPVPLSLQSLAVLVIGVWLGPRLGAAVVVGWLALAAAGLPVLAEGKSGLGGPTLGFLVAMPFAAALAGRWPRFPTMLAAHALILVAGWCWLATIIGPLKALSAGVLPFLPGALIKSLLAAAFAARLRKAPQSANQSR
ncbi:biotin transporter BioY [Polymorphobacter multimanifer]|uniref:Biotin transporter n=1 Tax=Polymorphobacter multimanifer TaxID=1070431 RepID=A0A841L8F5_9SPHN|nr:biotin transporter BioY [Polymorphobacter multimanifer]MBB6228476.1 biotin transport system substrate-specific component [Polymorphobacter multimanifer]GGI80520.1 biotin transporter BioY [Polymorphobacter multimanifer]